MNNGIRNHTYPRRLSAVKVMIYMILMLAIALPVMNLVADAYDSYVESIQSRTTIEEGP